MREVTLDLGIHYEAWKKNEKAKDKDKAHFFALINQIISEYEPEEMLYEVVGRALPEDKAIARAEKYNPRYEVEVIRASEHGYEAIMVERPEFRSFVFVNAEDGMLYQRQVVDGGQLLDDERLRDEDPDLYEEATFELPWGERIVRPFDSLGPIFLAAVQQYIYRGKPTVKLPAPRQASDEELESLGS